MNPDMLTTKKLPAMTMAQLVYGKPPARRFPLPKRLIFVAAVLSTMAGCATGRPAVVEVESVGTLSASYHSVAVAPVHATTDLTPSFGVVDTDEEAPVTGSAPAEQAEAPDIAPKAGLVLGAVRQ